MGDVRLGQLRLPDDDHHRGLPAISLPPSPRPICPPAVATARFAWATTIAVAIVAVLGPILGAIADYRAMKKRMLGAFMASASSPRC